MQEGLRRDLTRAIAARDFAAVSALRSTLAAIQNAEAVDIRSQAALATPDARIAGSVSGLGGAEVQRRGLTATELQAIVRAELDERVAAALDYERLGQRERADRLRAEAEVLARYLR